MDIIRFDKKTDAGVISAFADVYEKLKVQHGVIMKLVLTLMNNRLITLDQAHAILDLALDQISDPEERERCKRELNDGTDQLIRSDAKDHEDTNSEA